MRTRRDRRSSERGAEDAALVAWLLGCGAGVGCDGLAAQPPESACSQSAFVSWRCGEDTVPCGGSHLVKTGPATHQFHRSTALSSSRPFLADAAGSSPRAVSRESKNGAGAPSSFAALSPRRLRASSRDGGGVVNRPRHPSLCSFPDIQDGESCSPLLSRLCGCRVMTPARHAPCR